MLQGGQGSVLVQASDEVFELVSEAGAHSLAGAGDLGCNGQAGHLLHQPLPAAPHHLHQICTCTPIFAFLFFLYNLKVPMRFNKHIFLLSFLL